MAGSMANLNNVPLIARDPSGYEKLRGDLERSFEQKISGSKCPINVIA
jgi:hypothetical protein